MKRSKYIIVTFVVVFLIISVICVIFIKNNKNEETTKSSNTVTSEIMLEEGQKINTTESGYFTLQMQMQAVSDDGKIFKGEIGNAYENTNKVFITISHKETGEEIFKSNVFPVGTQIDEFEISRKLDSGTYDAIMTLHSMEDDEITEISKVNVEYTLVVN